MKPKTNNNNFIILSYKTKFKGTGKTHTRSKILQEKENK